MHLLDTNAWAQYLNNATSTVAQRLERTAPGLICLCSVVKGELYFGAYKSARRDANLSLLARLFARFDSLSFDDHAADRYGEIRAHLAQQGTPIGPNDLMIAAIALAHECTVVTHNYAEFSRVPGLEVEDWQQVS